MRFQNWLFFILVALSCPANAARKGLTFYLHWDEQAASQCAKAVARIEKPYAPLNTGLFLREERGTTGMFDDIVFGTRKSSKAIKAMNSFPSFQDPITKRALKRRLSETPETVALRTYLPRVTESRAVLEKGTDANCLGAAMGWFGFYNSLYSLGEDTFKELLREKFTRIKPGGTLTPETLVVWRHPQSHQSGLIHAAVLLDSDVVWHRPGSTPAGFTTFARALNRYGGRNGGNDDALITFHQLKPLKPIEE